MHRNRKTTRGADEQAFGARLGAGQQLHLRQGHTEGLGKEAAQGRVGLTLDRGGLNTDTIVIPLSLNEGVPFPPGQDLQLELQVIPSPLVPAPGLHPKAQNGLPVRASKGGTSSI